jgi:hypothetical protein
MSNLSADSDISNPKRHNVTPAQLTVDSYIGHRAVPYPLLLLQVEADFPHLLRLERAFRAD